VHANVETDERIKTLIATIQTEPDPKKLTALVAELNQLLDGDQRNENERSSSTQTLKISRAS
jgi:hypothetical protein